MVKDKGLDQRVTFMTTAEQRQWLIEQSALTGAPLGEIIRRAIESYRRQQEVKQ